MNIEDEIDKLFRRIHSLEDRVKELEEMNESDPPEISELRRLSEANRNQDSEPESYASTTSDLSGLDKLTPEFTSKLWYNRAGNYLQCIFKNEEYFRERVDGVLTLYHSEKTCDVIGYQIKGIREMQRFVQ